MTEYTTFEGSNMGGIAPNSITLVALQDISAQSKTIVVYTEAYKLYFTDGTASHEEVQKSTAQGQVFEQDIAFNIPKNRTNIREWLTANHSKYFYVQYIDTNGYAIELPVMRLLAKFTTDRQGRGKNEFEFRLQGNTLLPAKPARILSKTIDYNENDYNSTDYN